MKVLLIVNHLTSYPSWSTLTYYYSIGSTLYLILINQIVSGLLLTIYYINFSGMAFSSIAYIMTQCNNGWVIRLFHMIGASFFLLTLYIHTCRGLYYKSSTNSTYIYVWLSGVVILVTSFMIAFLGYILVWGQMSYWGATVIINIFTILSIGSLDIGLLLASFLWSNYIVVLTRAFTIHYLVSTWLIILSLIHISLLHLLNTVLVSNVSSYTFISSVSTLLHNILSSYILVTYIWFVIICYYTFFSFNYIHTLGANGDYLGISLINSDNSIKANPIITPVHIVPEWYFLVYYAILRAFSNKLIGVLMVVLFFIFTIFYSIIFVSSVSCMYLFKEFGGFRPFIGIRALFLGTTAGRISSKINAKPLLGVGYNVFSLLNGNLRCLSMLSNRSSNYYLSSYYPLTTLLLITITLMLTVFGGLTIEQFHTSYTIITLYLTSFIPLIIFFL